MSEEKKNEFVEEYSLIPDPQNTPENSPASEAVSAQLANASAPKTVVESEPLNAPANEQTAPAVDFKSARRTYSRVGLAVAVYILVTYVASFACVFVMAAIDKRMLATDIYQWVISIIPQYVFAVPAALLVLWKVPKANIEKNKLSFPKLLLFFLLCFGLMGFGSILSNVVTTLVNIFTGISFEPVVEEMLSSVSIWYNIIVVAILAPIFEELVFRKLIIDRLAAFGERSAILISALLFGLLHGNFSQLFYAAFIGIILGYVYCRTGKVRYTILLHMAFNALGGVFTSWLTSNLDIDKMSSLTDADAMVEFIAENLWYLILYFGYNLLFFGSMIATLILLIVLFRRAWSTFDRELIPGKHRGRTVMLNFGMIAVCVVIALEFILNIMSYN